MLGLLSFLLLSSLPSSFLPFYTSLAPTSIPPSPSFYTSLALILHSPCRLFSFLWSLLSLLLFPSSPPLSLPSFFPSSPFSFVYHLPLPSFPTSFLFLHLSSFPPPSFVPCTPAPVIPIFLRVSLPPPALPSCVPTPSPLFLRVSLPPPRSSFLTSCR